MQSFESINDFSCIQDNKIIGAPVEMNNSVIEFYGKNNIIYFDESVILDSSTIHFFGNNSVIFISSGGYHKTKVKIDIYNNSAFYIGKNCNTTRPIHVLISEQKHIIIGNDCLFSLNIWFRNSDPHLIYDAETKNRINPTKSVFVGDHVWIGQEAFIFKGSKIGSGSIIGAKSVVTGKTIQSNSSSAGVPCKVLKQGVFWLKPSVHIYDEEKTKASQTYDKDTYIYNQDQYTIDYMQIDEALSSCKNSDELLECIKTMLFENTHKNRFYIPPAKKKDFFSKVFGK